MPNVFFGRIDTRNFRLRVRDFLTRITSGQEIPVGADLTPLTDQLNQRFPLADGFTWHVEWVNFGQGWRIDTFVQCVDGEPQGFDYEVPEGSEERESELRDAQPPAPDAEPADPATDPDSPDYDDDAATGDA